MLQVTQRDVEVRVYHGRTVSGATKHFERDAAQMASHGWVPISQVWAEGQHDCATLGCLVLVLSIIGLALAYLFPPDGALTVTYLYQGRDAAMTRWKYLAGEPD